MSDFLEFRNMQTDDLEQIMEIETASFTDAWTKDGFLQSMQQVYAHMIVAKIQDEIVGYGCLYHILDEGEIINVAVHPDWRKKGVGKQILNELLLNGKKLGVTRFILDVRASNEAAQCLYESVGFKKIAVQKHFYDTPVEDGWLMERLI